MLAKYIRENRVSLDDIRALISSMLAYDVEEIQSVLKDKKGKPPATIILILRSIIADMKKGEISNFEKLLDRAYGKPEKTINHEIGAIDPKTLLMLNAAFVETPTPKPKAKPNEQKPRAR
ncbi:MAG: hypothetical protein LBB89_12350 [Treponema sp.]|nr:hypothetical protein [Treponema sp.]